MTPDHLREIADRPHVPADAQEALYIAAAKIEGAETAQAREFGLRLREARANANACRQHRRFGFLQATPLSSFGDW